MTKQAILTNFPCTFFASAKRKQQALIQKNRAKLIQQSILGYAQLFSKVIDPSFLATIDPSLRKRIFCLLPVFWAWVGQILEGNASCLKALSFIQSWYRCLSLPIPSSDTSGYCNARKRLKPQVLTQVHSKTIEALERGVQSKDLWLGHKLVAIDGTSVTLDDTAKIKPSPLNLLGKNSTVGSLLWELLA